MDRGFAFSFTSAANTPERGIDGNRNSTRQHQRLEVEGQLRFAFHAARPSHFRYFASHKRAIGNDDLIVDRYRERRFSVNTVAVLCVFCVDAARERDGNDGSGSYDHGRLNFAWINVQ